MASVNKFIGIGNLTRDPEVKQMTNGEAVANCAIACNEKWTAKDGSKQEKVEFINLIFYRRLAEIAGEWLKKGAMIYVEGKITTQKWTDKEGKDRYTTSVIVNEMTMLGGKRSDEEKPADVAPVKDGGFDDFGDDLIPF